MAGKARFHERRIDELAIRVEVTESPAARRRVLFRVLNHELNVCRRPGSEKFPLAKNFVVLVRRRVTVMQRGNHRAVRRRTETPGGTTPFIPSWVARGWPESGPDESSVAF